jgi:hypothetical protein
LIAHSALANPLSADIDDALHVAREFDLTDLEEATEVRLLLRYLD